MWTIFKVFTEFATILLLSYAFWFFGHEAGRILAPRPGVELVPPLHEGEVLTIGPPGKSLALSLTFVHGVQEVCYGLAGSSEGLILKGKFYRAWQVMFQ